MNATRKYGNSRLSDRLTLSLPDLQEILSCGRACAERIGEEAGARIKVGKRVLYNVDKIRAYLDSLQD